MLKKQYFQINSAKRQLRGSHTMGQNRCLQKALNFYLKPKVTFKKPLFRPIPAGHVVPKSIC
ncbi:hypothetical protein, partial [Paraglaciecola sp.]|uniref:hypothetical protein n=1 Tax=Paraglaciecola sp. TaxID=1920173 RepID=UPI0030F453F4